jgi:GGDEF domain-containing protein
MTGAAFLAALLLGVLAVGCAAWYRARFIAAARLSRTDDLTGLGNRRALLADLGQALADGGPLSLMLLDLDGFKAVNDLHGHGVGDQVLRLVGGRLGEVLGAGPRLARLGGDEFAVVVLDDDLGRLLGRAGAGGRGTAAAGRVGRAPSSGVGRGDRSFACRRRCDRPAGAGGPGAVPGEGRGRAGGRASRERGGGAGPVG